MQIPILFFTYISSISSIGNKILNQRNENRRGGKGGGETRGGIIIAYKSINQNLFSP